jgi:hypothetical protein
VPVLEGVPFPAVASLEVGVTLGRIGGGLIILGVAASAYVLGQPLTEVDGRLYGPDVTVSAAVLGIGAAVVSAAGSRPLDARLTRFGLSLLALGGLAVVVAKAIENIGPMAALTPLVIAIAALTGGCLASGLSLLRSTGLVRAVGAVVLLGLFLVIVGNVVSGGQVTPPAILLAGYAVTGLGLAGVAVLALGIPRLQQGASV